MNVKMLLVLGSVLLLLVLPAKYGYALPSTICYPLSTGVVCINTTTITGTSVTANELDPFWGGNNSLVARTGTCVGGNSTHANVSVNTTITGVTCVMVSRNPGSGGGSGTVTSVATNTSTGLIGGTITTTGTLYINSSKIQTRVNETCSAGSSIRVINEDGSVTCETDSTGISSESDPHWTANESGLLTNDTNLQTQINNVNLSANKPQIDQNVNTTGTPTFDNLTVSKLVLSNLNLTQNKQIILSANTSTGGITKSIRFNMNTEYDRPWLAWYNENGVLATAVGYHSRDYSSNDSHNAFEVKTVAADNVDMRTRLSIGNYNNLTQATFNYASEFYIRNGDTTKLLFNTTSDVLKISNGSNIASSVSLSGDRAVFGYNAANAYVQGGSTKGLVLQTDGSTTRLFISSAGAVGINTSTPSQTFNVLGTGNITGALTLGASVCSAGQVLTTNSTGQVTCVTDSTGTGNASFNQTLTDSLYYLQGNGNSLATNISNVNASWVILNTQVTNMNTTVNQRGLLDSVYVSATNLFNTSQLMTQGTLLGINVTWLNTLFYPKTHGDSLATNISNVNLTLESERTKINNVNTSANIDNLFADDLTVDAVNANEANQTLNTTSKVTFNAVNITGLDGLNVTTGNISLGVHQGAISWNTTHICFGSC